MLKQLCYEYLKTKSKKASQQIKKLLLEKRLPYVISSDSKFNTYNGKLNQYQLQYICECIVNNKPITKDILCPVCQKYMKRDPYKDTSICSDKSNKCRHYKNAINSRSSKQKALNYDKLLNQYNIDQLCKLAIDKTKNSSGYYTRLILKHQLFKDMFSNIDTQFSINRFQYAIHFAKTYPNVYIPLCHVCYRKPIYNPLDGHTCYDEQCQIQHRILKTKKTLQKKYGVSHIMQIANVKAKVIRSYKVTMRKRKYQEALSYAKIANVTVLTPLETFVKQDTFILELMCNNCKKKFKRDIRQYTQLKCPYCNPSLYGSSLLELKLEKFLQDLGVKYHTHFKYTKPVIYPRCFSMFPYLFKQLDFVNDIPYSISNNRLYKHEFDFYIQHNNRQLFIEVHGCRYHDNDLSIIQKICDSIEYDIPLLSIYEPWVVNKDKFSIIQSILAYKLGIVNRRFYARNVVIYKVNDNEKQLAQNFIQENHLYGNIGANDYYLLLHKDEPIGAFSIKHIDNHTIELSRICFKPFTACIGCISKVLTFLIRNYNMNVITYAHAELSSDPLKCAYTTKLEFVGANIALWLTDGYKLYHRLLLSKIKQKDESQQEALIRSDLFMYKSLVYKYYLLKNPLYYTE